MLFKKLRTRSSSKSTNQSIARITSTSSSMNKDSRLPNVVVTAPSRDSQGTTEDEANDYQKFLAKSKKEEEKAEKKRLKEIEKARQVTLSPWASRM